MLLEEWLALSWRASLRGLVAPTAQHPIRTTCRWISTSETPSRNISHLYGDDKDEDKAHGGKEWSRECGRATMEISTVVRHPLETRDVPLISKAYPRQPSDTASTHNIVASPVSEQQ